MAEKKPGFFRRIFSFGRKTVTEPEPEVTETPPAEVPAEPEAVAEVSAEATPAPEPVEAVSEPAPEPVAAAPEPAPQPEPEPEPQPESEPEPEPETVAEPPRAEAPAEKAEPPAPAEEAKKAETPKLEKAAAKPAAKAAVKTPAKPKKKPEPPKPEARKPEPAPKKVESSKPAESAPEPAAKPAPKPEPKTAKAPPPEPPKPAAAKVETPPAPEPTKPAQPPEPTPAPPVAKRPTPDGPRPTGKVTLFDQKAPAEAAPEPAQEKTGWFNRLKKGLSRSSNALTENIASVFVKRRLDDDTLQDLEDLLIQADLGLETAMRVTDALSEERYGKDISDHEVRAVMASEIEKVLTPVALPLELDLEHRPHVILVVGVNGSGKTTTIGKMSAKLRDAGLSTLLVAGDTFRAAAIEQLKIWGDRTGSPVAARELGADAAGLAFDAWQQAKDEGHDVMLMDTAGRLQNKAELMAELEKIIRVLKKHDPDAPHTVLLTLDATTGQNALNQVEIFGQKAGVNGLVMTKLDGTARGGILVAIAAKHQLPVFFLGVGESVDDLEPFEAADFARSIAGLDEPALGQSVES